MRVRSSSGAAAAPRANHGDPELFSVEYRACPSAARCGCCYRVTAVTAPAAAAEPYIGVAFLTHGLG